VGCGLPENLGRTFSRNGLPRLVTGGCTPKELKSVFENVPVAATFLYKETIHAKRQVLLCLILPIWCRLCGFNLHQIGLCPIPKVQANVSNKSLRSTTDLDDADTIAEAQKAWSGKGFPEMQPRRLQIGSWVFLLIEAFGFWGSGVPGIPAGSSNLTQKPTKISTGNQF